MNKIKKSFNFEPGIIVLFLFFAFIIGSIFLTIYLITPKSFFSSSSNQQNIQQELKSFERNPNSYLVVIDAGHGGDASGAVGEFGTLEKDLNLKVAMRIKELLKDTKNIQIYLTRTGDFNLSLKERTEIANVLEANMFISIHLNSSPSRNNVDQSEIYYYEYNRYEYKNRLIRNSKQTMSEEELQTHSQVKGGTIYQSIIFAQSLKQILNKYNLRIKNIMNQNFEVLVLTKCPAILFELNYLNNPKIEDKFINGNYIDMYANIVKEALYDYYSIK